MKYCPHCHANRSTAQIDDFGNCVVCGNPVVDDPSEAKTMPLQAPEGSGAAGAGTSEPPPESAGREGTELEDGDAGETAEPEVTVGLEVTKDPEATDPEAAAPETAAPETREGDTAGEDPDPVKPWVREQRARKADGEPSPDRGTPAIDTATQAIGQPWRKSTPDPEPAREPSSDAFRTRAQPSTPRDDEPMSTDYAKVVAEIEANLREGYRSFGLVGGPSSGKTHALKALHYLLGSAGARSDKAALEFRRAVVPGPTGAKVGHYDFVGPATRWTFIDPGGELYDRLQKAEAGSLDENTARLSRWLYQCDGLLCFLHLRQGHFGGPVLDADPTLAEDDETRDQITKARKQAREDQAELEALPNYLLFLRALRAEGGDIGKVLEAIRASASLDEALHTYDQTTPPLDIPVMFFFTKADIYQREDFAVDRGTYVNPRNLDLPAAVFTARYLPTLFTGVASQVQRFKFDFLQSYEEAETERSSGTEPIMKTYWEYPDEARSFLSVGLLSGMEFMLRNQPRQRRRWEPPQLDTRQSLKLHRWLHPARWNGVPRGILGSWSQPAPLVGSEPDEAPDGSPDVPPPPPPPPSSTPAEGA